MAQYTFVGNLGGTTSCQAADSLLSVLLLVFFNHIFLVLWDSRWRFNRKEWWKRVPSMATTIGKHTTAKAAGEALPRIAAAEPFYQWFIWIGGAGFAKLV